MKSLMLGTAAVPGCAPALNARARGLYGVRLEASDAGKILAELKTTFEAFKQARDQELAELKKGIGDCVQADKVERINAEIVKLQAALDETNALIAAARIGAGSGNQATAEQREHARAFELFFRKGNEAGLRELEVKAAARSDSNPDGGYVVPEQVEQTIDRVLGTVSMMRSIASVMTISSALYKKLVNQGAAAYGWVGERQSRSETATPTLAALEFPTMELYANPAATQGVLDDARIDIGAWLGEEVSTVFAEAEGAAFVTGTGVNQPRGVASYTMVANASYVWGKIGFLTTGVASALSDATHNGVDALIDLVYGLKQGYRQNARFLMNRTTQAAVRKLKTIGDTEAYLWQPPVQAGQPASLLGYPITDDDNVADVAANASPVLFGDFRRGYLIVDRAGIRVLRDPFTNKPYVHFYTTKRVGGGVQNFEAIKALKISA